MNHIFTEKNIRLFTKVLFERYTKQHGYSLSKLDKYSFIPVDMTFPKVFYEVNGNTTTPLIVHYLIELSSRGLVNRKDQTSMSFNLTPVGYTKGYEIKHPFKYFIQTHWRWFFGTVIIGIIIAGCTLATK